MSEDLYSVRVYFDGMLTGCIKIPGVYRSVSTPPIIPGLPVLELIDYAPALGVAEIRPCWGKRREMELDEVASVVAWLSDVKDGKA
jgi:hypothetical protein